MSKKKIMHEQFSIRLDNETDRLLTMLSNRLNSTRVDAVRAAIKVATGDDITRKIADRLDEIDRRIETSNTSTAAQILKLSQQFLMSTEAAEDNHTNVIKGLTILLERSMK